MINKNKHLIAWVQYDGLGNPIPSTLIFRSFKDRPRQGKYVAMQPQTLCCNGLGNSTITFINNSSDTTITSITATGGIINYTAGLEAGDRITFIIPMGWHEAITILNDETDDITFTSATVQGDGVITPASYATPGASMALNTTGVPNSQYFVTISDT